MMQVVTLDLWFGIASYTNWRKGKKKQSGIKKINIFQSVNFYLCINSSIRLLVIYNTACGGNES